MEQVLYLNKCKNGCVDMWDKLVGYGELCVVDGDT